MGQSAEVVVFGARGTFEQLDDVYRGMGPTVAGVTDKLAADLAQRRPDMSLVRRGVAYAASPWRYQRNCDRGAAMLAAALVRDLGDRRDRRLVLIGLSQGADVVRRSLGLLDASLRDRVAAVVLMGDPTRDPGQPVPYQHGTTDPHCGILARFARPVPAELWSRTWAYCLDGDHIAANRSGPVALMFSGTHTCYEQNRDHVQDRAAAFVAEQILGGD